MYVLPCKIRIVPFVLLKWFNYPLVLDWALNLFHWPNPKVFFVLFQDQFNDQLCLVALTTMGIATHLHVIQGMHVILMHVTQGLHIIHMDVAFGSNTRLFSSTTVHGFLVHHVERHVVDHLAALIVTTGSILAHLSSKNSTRKICHLISKQWLNRIGTRQISSDIQDPHPSSVDNKTTASVLIKTFILQNIFFESILKTIHQKCFTFKGKTS